VCDDEDSPCASTPPTINPSYVLPVLQCQLSIQVVNVMTLTMLTLLSIQGGDLTTETMPSYAGSV
jgi:hypothetical protein